MAERLPSRPSSPPEPPPAPRARLYGVDLATNHPLASSLDRPRGGSRVEFRCRATAPVPAADTLLAAAEVAYASPLRHRGRSAARLLRVAPGLEVISFSSIADFWLGGQGIDCHLRSPEHDYLVEIRLLGPVFAYWLECAGLPALHAAAVTVGAGAVAFASGNRGGKSSLAAAFVQRGASLLSDDIVPLELPAEERPRARPGYPQMRMWPREAARFVGSTDGLHRVHPRYTKLRVPVGHGGFGRFEPRDRPLAAVYLVERAEEGGDAAAGPAIERLAPHEAIFELARHSFSPRLVAAAGLDRERLPKLASLVERVPVRRLHVPPGERGLDLACAAVTADLATRPKI